MNKTLNPVRFRRAALAAVGLWLLAALMLQAAVLPAAKPESVGLSPERLERLSRVMQEAVDNGKTAGLVALIYRNGKVAYLESFGKLDLAAGAPMPVNGIFRIASQTKAVTTTAVMILMEEGRILLDDPVARYIPEFAGARVAVTASR